MFHVEFILRLQGHVLNAFLFLLLNDEPHVEVVPLFLLTLVHLVSFALPIFVLHPAPCRCPELGVGKWTFSVPPLIRLLFVSQRLLNGYVGLELELLSKFWLDRSVEFLSQRQLVLFAHHQVDRTLAQLHRPVDIALAADWEWVGLGLSADLHISQVQLVGILYNFDGRVLALAVTLALTNALVIQLISVDRRALNELLNFSEVRNAFLRAFVEKWPDSSSVELFNVILGDAKFG